MIECAYIVLCAAYQTYDARATDQNRTAERTPYAPFVATPQMQRVRLGVRLCVHFIPEPDYRLSICIQHQLESSIV